MESLVFNATYKSLAAEWLGLSSQDLAQDAETSSKKRKSHGIDGSNVEEAHVSQIKKQKNNKLEKEKPENREKLTTYMEVGGKLQKKLAKAKRRANERIYEKHEHVTVAHDDDGSDDEENKCGAVAKKVRQDDNKAQPLTIEDIQRRLKDRNSSKTAKKKLRRKLHHLQEKSKESSPQVKSPTLQKSHKENKPSPVKSTTKIKQKEINDFSKSFTEFVKDAKKNTVNVNQNSVLNNSEVPTSNNINPNRNVVSSKLTNKTKPQNNAFFVDRMGSSVDTGEKHSNKKTRRKHRMKSLHTDEMNEMQKKTRTEGVTTSSENTTQGNVQNVTEEKSGDDSVKQKRKRHKKRSKQKNIKKDHRPDELKPAYLKGAGQKRVEVKSDQDHKQDIKEDKS